MNEQSRKLLDKAGRAIHAAEVLLKEGEAEFAAGRAYYAMFYAAEALLLAMGLRFRKHSSVHAAFGERFVKTGAVDSKFHRWLLDAFDRRIVADYETASALAPEDVSRMIEQAREFVDEARRCLEATPADKQKD